MSRPRTPAGAGYRAVDGVFSRSFLYSAARAMMDSDKSAEDIARQSMAIAADICVYTNGNLTVETISG